MHVGVGLSLYYIYYKTDGLFVNEYNSTNCSTGSVSSQIITTATDIGCTGANVNFTVNDYFQTPKEGGYVVTCNDTSDVSRLFTLIFSADCLIKLLICCVLWLIFASGCRMVILHCRTT